MGLRTNATPVRNGGRAAAKAIQLEDGTTVELARSVLYNDWHWSVVADPRGSGTRQLNLIVVGPAGWELHSYRVDPELAELIAEAFLDPASDSED